MINITFLQAYKSIPINTTIEVPDFCVLTGKNGSGKSHLLEAIANPNITLVTNQAGTVLANTQFIPYNGLNPNIEEQCNSNTESHALTEIWINLEPLIQRCISDAEEAYARTLGHFSDSFTLLDRISKRSGKKITDINETLFRQYLKPTEISKGNLFFSQMALIFMNYHRKLNLNRFNQYKNERFGLSLKTLTEEQFIELFGPPPWKLINLTLSKAGLNYEVNSPEDTDENNTFTLELIDHNCGIKIKPQDLSTGERVLMALSLAIYNTQENTSKKDLLLIDEPDAALHPEFSKFLLDTLTKILVEELNVKVIMTTHSPTTVALSPDNSVFQIEKDSKNVQMISITEGIKVLTKDIPHLQVSYEDRRQVFVESKYDVEYFQSLFNTLNRKHSYSYSPIFLEPHNKNSSNCTDVINIVNSLANSGNDLVRGIIDFDNSNLQKHPIYVLGNGSRYSIENYLLDPIYIVLSLIRNCGKTFSDFNLQQHKTYTDAKNLTQTETQSLINSVMSTLGFNLNKTQQNILENNFKIDYPSDFFQSVGHTYERLLLGAFPMLNSMSRGKGDSVLKLAVLNVIDEHPQFLSLDLHETFSMIA